MKSWTQFLFFIIGLVCSGNAAIAQVNDVPFRIAPKIQFGKCLGMPSDCNIQFSGKTVVLEFWATWCNPCIQAISHINSLASKFDSDSVIFISITKEAANDVERFTKTKVIKSIIAIDDSGKTNSNYKIRSIPKTFIIDSYGYIAWEGHPNSITENLLSGIIRKKNNSIKPD